MSYVCFIKPLHPFLIFRLCHSTLWLSQFKPIMLCHNKRIRRHYVATFFRKKSDSSNQVQQTQPYPVFFFHLKFSFLLAINPIFVYWVQTNKLDMEIYWSCQHWHATTASFLCLEMNLNIELFS